LFLLTRNSLSLSLSLDDSGICHLLLLASLKNLDLGGTSITDDGLLMVINGLRQLDQLAVCNNSQITPRGTSEVVSQWVSERVITLANHHHHHHTTFIVVSASIGLATLSRAASLRRMCIEGCSAIDPTARAQISKQLLDVRLRKLQLARAPVVEMPGMSKSVSMTQLVEVPLKATAESSAATQAASPPSTSSTSSTSAHALIQPVFNTCTPCSLAAAATSTSTSASTWSNSLSSSSSSSLAHSIHYLPPSYLSIYLPTYLPIVKARILVFVHSFLLCLVWCSVAPRIDCCCACVCDNHPTSISFLAQEYLVNTRYLSWSIVVSSPVILTFHDALYLCSHVILIYRLIILVLESDVTR